MDLYFKADTICAIATPVGEGGIGIIKISGPEAVPIVRNLFRSRRPQQVFADSHRLYHGWIVNPITGESVDEVLVSYMSAPHTYTREDIVEINCHSGYAVLDHILQLVLAQGARLAEPGEFTRRAFLNGRIDLTQAEAIADVIHARSRESLLLANKNLEGGLRASVQSWQQTLLGLHSQLEAHIDFCDDLEEEASDFPQFIHRLEEELVRPLRLAVEHSESARLIREGLTLVLVGKPNAGKSSLLNALLGRDRAIVTALPGTTRDIIEDSFSLAGVLVRILDTAGIRHEPDEIESLGIERTMQSVKDADVVFWLIDQSRPLSREDHMVFQTVTSAPYIILLNKADLPAAVSEQDVREQFGSAAPLLKLSVFEPSHIDRLRDHLRKTCIQCPLEMGRSLIVTNLRHKALLEQAVASLVRAGNLLADGAYSELVSLELSSARRDLDAIVGRCGDDELLDAIFSEFCIGK